MESLAARRSRLWQGLPTLPLAALLLTLAGCATYQDKLVTIRDRFHAGDLAGAELALDEAQAKPKNDADVLALERAIVLLSEGRPSEAEATLRQVRDRFDHLQQANLAESTLSMLTDANQKAYAGEDHERVLIRVFLALSNLMADGGDAGAYALQTNELQRQIAQSARKLPEPEKPKHAPPEQATTPLPNPALAYRPLAIGPYIYGMLREETHSAYDDVERASALVVSWRPEFSQGVADLERARHGRHSSPDAGVLYVFALVGRGPYKQEEVEVASSVSLLIADQILSHNLNKTLPPTIAPIKIPRVVVPYNGVDRVAVRVNGEPMGATETITDIGQMALAQHEANFPWIMAEAVARRVVKKGIIYGAKELVDSSRVSLGSFALDAAGVIWEATESADTRCWGLLPEKIQVLRLELPVGDLQIGLLAQGSTFLPATESFAQVSIRDGRNSYLLANFPDGRLVGRISAR